MNERGSWKQNTHLLKLLKWKEFFMMKQLSFSFFFPFIWASFSVLAKPYFIMILTMSKIVKLKSGDRLLAEIELFIFFWQMHYSVFRYVINLQYKTFLF